VAFAFTRELQHPAEHKITIPLDGESVDMWIPTERAANLAWRKDLARRCEDDEDIQKAVLALCASPSPEGFLFWCNAFGWTFRQQEITNGIETAVSGQSAHRPFILWPVQTELARTVIRTIDRPPDDPSSGVVVVDKSRKMGATYEMVAIAEWYWLFRPGTNSLLISRVEDAVDSSGNTGSLFWMLDYMREWLPAWMRPPEKRNLLTLQRQDVPGTTVKGLSTTGKQARGLRGTFALIDEAAFIDVLDDLLTGLSQTVPTRIFVSTAKPGSVFSRKLVRSKSAKVFRVPWWDHPEMGAGRYVKADPETSEQIISSPYRDLLVLNAEDPREVTQELDMDHAGEGFVVFRDRPLTRHESTSACKPELVGDIRWVGTGIQDLSIRAGKVEEWGVEETPRGRLSLWTPLEHGRPDQLATYVMGCDISFGLHGSNSVACIYAIETREQVGEYVTASQTPEEFARTVAMLGHWLGGSRGCAALAWEANGAAGQTFGNKIRDLRYPWVWFGVDKRAVKPKTEQTWGWWSNATSKPTILTELDAAIGADRFVPRCQALIDECRDYVWYNGGGCGPATLRDEGGDAKATHGDRVIAAAIAYHASLSVMRCNPPLRKIEPGTMAALLQANKAPIPYRQNVSERRLTV
jgi:hypothetical protein